MSANLHSVEPQATSQRMQCMEIWGGNQAIAKRFSGPGIDVDVRSVPYGASRVGGGDIYYGTSCASGRITRLMLADVSGHGESAARLAVQLRDLMRANVNTIDQERFVGEMNREFGQLAEESGFATAVVATYFAPRRRLTLSIAGHPLPFYFSGSRRRWTHVLASEVAAKIPGNLPLGVLADTSYAAREIECRRGDMFLLYSDAYIEAVDGEGELLGMDGLLRILNERTTQDPAAVISEVRARVADLNPQNLQGDDATLILATITESPVRWRDNLLAPWRLFRPVADATRLQA